MATNKIYAITKERENPSFVTTLTDDETKALGDFGIGLLVQEWCEKKKLTYIDFGS